ncbi:unnamed protein product [Closterium sp. NIES-65]|nr:unnamed protein product [Closterium sp. NIES-65]
MPLISKSIPIFGGDRRPPSHYAPLLKLRDAPSRHGIRCFAPVMLVPSHSFSPKKQLVRGSRSSVRCAAAGEGEKPSSFAKQWSRTGGSSSSESAISGAARRIAEKGGRGESRPSGGKNKRGGGKPARGRASGDAQQAGENGDGAGAEGEAREGGGSGRRERQKRSHVVLEPAEFPEPMSRDPHVAILGGGMAGLMCALGLAERGIRSTVFDTGKHGLGGRMATREVEVAGKLRLFDHAAQFFTVTDSRFQSYVDRWLKEGALRVWEEGRIGTLQAGGAFSELPTLGGGGSSGGGEEARRLISPCGMRAFCEHVIADKVREGVGGEGGRGGGGAASVWIGKMRARHSGSPSSHHIVREGVVGVERSVWVGKMRAHLTTVLALCLLSPPTNHPPLPMTPSAPAIPCPQVREGVVGVERPVWIGKMRARGGKWVLEETGRKAGEFDFVVIAHNGKCANRLLAPAGIPKIARQMKRLELSSIWASIIAFEKPLLANGSTTRGHFDAAFVEGVPAVSWMCNNTAKLGDLGGAGRGDGGEGSGAVRRGEGMECWTVFSSAAYGKRNKVPQENIPLARAARVKEEMLEGVAAALGRPKDSLPAVLFHKIQLWGAALPLNAPTTAAGGGVECIMDASTRVGLCGDWLLAPSVQAAAISGLAMADKVLLGGGGAVQGCSCCGL